jgi:HSP20 family protein
MAGEEDFGSRRFWDLDLEEGDNELLVRAEVPGFQPNELDVQLNNDVLTIKAEKKQEAKEGEAAGKSHERRYMRYERRITLPPGTNPEKAEAHYQNGVLELRIPRSEAAKGRRIQIAGQAQGALPGHTATQQSKTTQRQDKASATCASSGAKHG